MSASRLPRPALALAAAAVAALISGCTAAPPDDDPPEPGQSPSAGAGSPTPSPSPSTTPLPEAADGTDLDACANVHCEVLVEEGDELALDVAYGVTVDEDGMGVSGYGPGIELSGQLPPPEEEEEPPTFVMNDIAITLVALDGSSAVMEMSVLLRPAG